MCSHYEGVKDRARLTKRFKVDAPAAMGKPDVWPLYPSVFIRRPREAEMDTGDEAVPEREAMLGLFGLVPHWAKDTKIGRNAFNCRSETVDSKPTFRDAWKKGQRCIIPAEAFFEPDWRSGKAIATRFTPVDGEDFGIAGIWAWCKPPGGEEILSFSMLTVNADDHELLRNYHKPGDEKRMVVILPAGSYSDWLTASPAESTEFIRQYPADQLIASATPPKPREETAPSVGKGQ
jgi:putative SOS response-associated peptidase YedK